MSRNITTLRDIQKIANRLNTLNLLDYLVSGSLSFQRWGFRLGMLSMNITITVELLC